MQPILIKSTIKQHTRRSKSGKISTVREHEDSRTKKQDFKKVIHAKYKGFYKENGIMPTKENLKKLAERIKNEISILEHLSNNAGKYIAFEGDGIVSGLNNYGYKIIDVNPTKITISKKGGSKKYTKLLSNILSGREKYQIQNEIKKAHVKQFQRKTPSGKMSIVREHEDKRNARKQDVKKIRNGKQQQDQVHPKVKQFIDEVNNITKEFTDTDKYSDVVKRLRTLNEWRTRVGIPDSYYERAQTAVRKRHDDLVRHGKKSGDFVEENGLTMRVRKNKDKKPKPKVSSSPSKPDPKKFPDKINKYDLTDILMKQGTSDSSGEMDEMDILEMLNYSSNWKLVEIPIAKIEGDYTADASKVNNDPIISNGTDMDFEVVDGKHRVGAARARGQKTIWGYIPESDEFNNDTQKGGLSDLSSDLQKKCQKSEPGKGGAISLKTSEVEELLKKGVVGFVSAGRSPHDDDTADPIMRDDKLKADLVKQGYHFMPVKGKYGEEEDSYMVMIPDASRNDMIKLGKKYNQDSVLHSDHDKNELIYTTGADAGKTVKGKGYKKLGDNATDNYTEVKTSDGSIRFSLNLKFGKSILKLTLFKSKKGEMKPGHKYIKRTGAPGHYHYEYPDDVSQTLFTDTIVHKEKTLISNAKVARSLIERDPNQPREDFNKAALNELAQSIQKIGIVQDPVVRPNPDRKGHYIIIAGERRWRASGIAGLKELHVKIYNTHDPAEILSLQVAENVAREDMNPIETANAYVKLMNVGYSLDEVAAKVGSAPLTVERKVGLLSLIPEFQDLLKTGNLGERQANIIAAGRLSPELQMSVLQRMNEGVMQNKALSGLVANYKVQQNQVGLFGAGAQEQAMERVVTKQRRNQIKKDLNRLLQDFGNVINRLSGADQIKLIPLLAKEKGGLDRIATKIDMLTKELIKINNEFKFAQTFFKEKSSIAGYVQARKIKPKKKRKKGRILKAIVRFIFHSKSKLKTVGLS